MTDRKDLYASRRPTWFVALVMGVAGFAPLTLLGWVTHWNIWVAVAWGVLGFWPCSLLAGCLVVGGNDDA